MRFVKALLPMIFVALSLTASAQARPSGPGPGQVARVEIGLGDAFFHANAPPSSCACFSLNGGTASAAVNLPHGISLVVDFSGVHAGHINGTAENITLFDYLGGPRYSYRTHSRITPYVQGLLGASTEHTNNAALPNSSAFAVSAGVGLNAILARHLSWTVFETDYVYSQLPNGVNGYQNDFRVSSSFVLRFGAH